MHVSLSEERIRQTSSVIDGKIAPNRDESGPSIDFSHGEVHAPGDVVTPGARKRVVSSPGSIPPAGPSITSARRAIFCHDFLRSGLPRTEKQPPRYSRSSGVTSRRCAAMQRAFSETSSPAKSAAEPPPAVLPLWVYRSPAEGQPGRP